MIQVKLNLFNYLTGWIKGEERRVRWQKEKVTISFDNLTTISI